MKIIPLLPILIPFTTALLCLLFPGKLKLRKIFGVAGSFVLLAAGVALLILVKQQGIQVVQLGGWAAPFGISVVIDLLSALMVLLTGGMSCLISIYALNDIDQPRHDYGFFPFFHFLLMGVCGTFITGDLFNLYVWFEVMLLSSFILLSLGGERAQLKGAIKYVTLNLVSSAIFLTALGILYGVSGTLNMADLALRLQHDVPIGLGTTVAMLFLVAFGIKAAIFPLFFWLPASYHTPPVSVTAIFSGLLTKVGVYALIRVFTLIFTQNVDYTHSIILVLAGLTMITGVLGAVAQNEMRRLLSFHIVSQIGYLLMGLGLQSVLALSGAIFFMVHVIVAKSALFLVSGIAKRKTGSFELEKIGGLYQSAPVLAACFLVSAFSLAGLPPFSGFFAKLTLVKAGLSEGRFGIVAVSLVVGVLTLFSMTKIWTQAFWKPKPKRTDSNGKSIRYKAPTTGFSYWAPLFVLSGITLLLGIFAESLLEISQQAAQQLLNPSLYIGRVMASKGGIL